MVAVLIELDRYARDPEEGDVTFGVGKNLYSVKSEVQNEEQLAFITEYITLVEEAVYSGDKNKFSELVDINSAVDMYLLQEFSKNIDAGFSSFYMYKNALFQLEKRKTLVNKDKYLKLK